MDFSKLPTSGQEFIEWQWEQIGPYFDELAARPLDAATIDAWLADWNRLSELLDEAGFRLYLRTTQDTTDEAAESRYERFNQSIRPQAAEAEQVLKGRLLTSKLEPQGFEISLEKMRLQAEIYREANLPLLSEELGLATDYYKISSAQRVEWEGRSLIMSEVLPLFEERDRAVRERAWKLRLGSWLKNRDAFDDVWLKLLKVRSQIARNAGEPNYRSYRWKQLLRLDYSPDDALRFHDAIEEVVVPVAVRLYEKRRQRLGLDRVRPWDIDVDPFDAPPLKPFETVEELETKISAVFGKVDPDFARYFEIMREEKLLDIESRPNKAPGGYSQALEVIRRPFIFFTCAGIQLDVDTLLHEGGHAFHTFETARLPYLAMRGEVGTPAEFAEVASIGMELLAMPYLGRADGGFYDAGELARVQYRKLEEIVLFWPYMSVVDSFQHWVYTHLDEAMDVAACDRVWRILWERFMQGVDWTGDGVEDFIPMRWREQTHLFDTPLYYVEYGLAQMGAVQVFGNAITNQQEAVARYRAALRLGGSRRLPELYQIAGAKLAFDTETLKKSIDLIEARLEELEKAL